MRRRGIILLAWLLLAHTYFGPSYMGKFKLEVDCQAAARKLVAESLRRMTLVCVPDGYAD